MFRFVAAMVASIAALAFVSLPALAQTACPQGADLDAALQDAVSAFHRAGGQKKSNKTSAETARLQAYAILLWQDRSKRAIDDQEDAKWALAVCLEKDGVCGGKKHKPLANDLFKAVGRGYSSGYMNDKVYPVEMIGWAERQIGCTTGPIATPLELAAAGKLPPLDGLTGQARFDKAFGRMMAKEEGDQYPQLIQACYEKSIEACDFLASAYEIGEDSTEADKKLALKYAEYSCLQNSAFGCRFAAIYYSQGRPGIPRDDATGGLRAIKACDLGDELSCGLAAAYYSTPDTPTYSEEKTRHYRSLDCERKNNPFSCRVFGYMASNGQGGAEDKVAARAAFQTACKGDEALACMWLGAMMRSGGGGPVDVEGGRAATQKACNLGNSTACNALGN
ncbi:MAG: tetratricopeptide repeat protein [Hyphomonas sp.]